MKSERSRLMRSRSIISIVGLFALSAMVLMVGGCSDDDPVSPPVIGANEAIDDPPHCRLILQTTLIAGESFFCCSQGYRYMASTQFSS